MFTELQKMAFDQNNLAVLNITRGYIAYFEIEQVYNELGKSLIKRRFTDELSKLKVQLDEYNKMMDMKTKYILILNELCQLYLDEETFIDAGSMLHMNIAGFIDNLSKQANDIDVTHNAWVFNTNNILKTIQKKSGGLF